MPRLNQEEIVTIRVLKDKGEGQRAIARRLGVTEGAVRYHLRKEAEGRTGLDGRRGKARKAQRYAEAIDAWMKAHEALEAQRPANIEELYEFLVGEHGYEGSYKSVLRYVRAEYPAPARRPYRRVELPAGAQGQVDWCERKVLVGGVEEMLNAFWAVLSHSRGEAVVWSPSMEQLAWQRCHNEGLRRLGGVPACIRIDNLKTGMAAAGPQGTVNPSYRRYAEAAGFHVDACPVRHPEAKGKVETRIGRLADKLIRSRPEGFESLEELQAYTDAFVAEEAKRRRCPATGQTVAEAWAAERELLRPADSLPEVFDVVVERKVGKDCMVNFEGRSYSVPFYLAWQPVEVRGGAGEVSFWHQGRQVARHPRRTPELILINQEHFEGEATGTHRPPLPLGRVGRSILELAEAPVALRAVDYYQQLMEVAS